MAPRSDGIAGRGRLAEGTTGNARQQEETAAYIAGMTGELATLAQSNGLDTLAYILDMARLEAENAIDTNEGTDKP
ncbi:MAG: hypothetical protein HY659_09890 [Rhizobiales bacterium]|nr:hypothetical protein [Hyphomicrobiales bacterium]